MRQYRTCSGCKADGAAARDGCSLRYPRDDVRMILGVVVQTRPAVPCPKPTNNEAFRQLLRSGAYYNQGVA